MKKLPKLLLHQHDIKNFIEDRDKFYQRYFNNYDEGDKEYYMVGRAVDYAIKKHYMSGESDFDWKCKECNYKHKPTSYRNTALAYESTNKDECPKCQKITEHEFFTDLYDNKDFESLSELNQTVVLAMVEGYVANYKEEFFHNFNVINYKVNFEKFLLYLSPDLTGLDYENNFWIIEIKTSAQPENHTALDFQTMMYIWGKYKYDFKAPKGVLKRILRKPRIKQNKKESFTEFQTRLMQDYIDRSEFYFLAQKAEPTREQIKDFEKYLKEICKDLYEAIHKKNKYKFYRATDRSWEI